MNSTTDSTTQQPQSVFGILSSGILLLSGCVFGLVVFLRMSAANMDHAIVNASTLALCFLGWLMVTLAFWISAAPRGLWKTVFFVPILSIAVFFTIYKIERVDGELVPHFTNRWAGEEALPDVATSNDGLPDETEAPQWLLPRDTDFPQFLGTNRDGILADIGLITDWESSAPEIKWKQPIGEGWSGFAIRGDLAITMEQRDEQEWVTAYDVRDGALRWKYVIPGLHFNPMGGTGPRSTPTISGDRVYAQSAVNKLVCLEFQTGEELWSKELLDGPQEEFEKKVTWGRSASPLVVGGRVIAAVGGIDKDAPALIAFDADSGEEMYRTGKGLQISYSSPTLATIGGVEQILYTSEQHISGFDLETGKMIWQHDAPGSSSAGANCSQPVAIDDSRILITKGYGLGGKLVKITPSTDGSETLWQTEELWSKASVLKTKFTSAVVLDGYAYALSDGILECVDIEAGKRVWKRGRYRQGQLLAVGDTLLVTSESGKVALVDATPEGFNELASLQVIGDVSWNTAAVSGNRLLMRNADEMACVILPTESPSENSDGQENSKEAGDETSEVTE